MRESFRYLNKIIGEIDVEKGVYISNRNEKHLFRKFNGFGISEAVLDELYKRNIDTILINYKDLICYYCDIDIFITSGIEYDDNGDKQLILEMDKWKIYCEKKDEQKCL